MRDLSSQHRQMAMMSTIQMRKLRLGEVRRFADKVGAQIILALHSLLGPCNTSSLIVNNSIS